MQEKYIKITAEKIKGSQNLVVLTGAGISAESGIPTFRGNDGLWKNFRPEELATPYAFERNPELVWEWYYWRRGIIKSARPNSGHRALSILEEILKDRFFLITQNVDGLHRIAGNKNLIEFHGNIWISRCTSCGREEWDYNTEYRGAPKCSECGGYERPGVVWFGESIPEDVLKQSFEKAGRSDVFLIVGTSAVVEPASSLVSFARSAGAFIAEINPSETPATQLCDVSFRGKAGKVLPSIVEEIEET